jgi:hypothetical protein
MNGLATLARLAQFWNVGRILAKQNPDDEPEDDDDEPDYDDYDLEDEDVCPDCGEETCPGDCNDADDDEL